MAGTMVHMLTCKITLEKLPQGKITSIPAFYVGNFAPDTIQERPGYKREWKMHTHFRTGIADCDFFQPDNLCLFEQRLKEFAKKQLPLCSTAAEYDFYLGYITHMLTDEEFMCSVRQEFMEAVSADGLTQFQEETFVRFTYDVDQIDFRIAAEEAGMDKVYDYIREAPVFGVREMVSAEEISKGKEWVLHTYYDNRPVYGEPVYLSYERMVSFAGKTAKNIVRRLDDFLPDGQ